MEGICPGGICPGIMCPGCICPGGKCPGGICPGGKCPGGYMSGGKCPGGTCPGFFFLSPISPPTRKTKKYKNWSQQLVTKSVTKLITVIPGSRSKVNDVGITQPDCQRLKNYFHSLKDT